MSYHNLLTEVAGEYVRSPIEFTVELDFQARLSEVFRANLRSRDSLFAEFENDTIRYTGDSPNYKESYVDHIMEKVGWSTQPFSRVHTEVAPYDSLIADNLPREHIDLVVFSERLIHPINWRGGSQRHHWDDYDIAIEIKYIKNKSKFPSSINESKTDDIPIQGLRNTIDLEENSLAPDLEELARLPKSTETYLMIVSNHDYLYRGVIDDLDDTKQRRYSRLGQAAIKELQSRAEGTHILYVHPTGWQWLSGNNISTRIERPPGNSE